MKKGLSLLFALTILLSGMHLSFATHFCAGEMVDARLTFGLKASSCCTDDHSKNDDLVLKNRCCANTLSSFNVDTQYVPSVLDLTVFNAPSFQLFLLPVQALPFCQESFLTSISTIKPPDKLQISSVELADIQVFVI